MTAADVLAMSADRRAQWLARLTDRQAAAFLADWSNWARTDQLAPAGERFGVRVDQLALFIAAAQEVRLAALEHAV